MGGGGGERERRFGALYGETQRRLLAYALRRAASSEDAADVVAETFTIAWRRLDDVPEGEAAILWLYATARRVLANQRRQAGRRAELVARIGQHLSPAPQREAEVGDGGALVARLALGVLGEADREILMLSGWEGLGSLELACALACSPTAARIRLHRARARLRVEMARLEQGSDAGDGTGPPPGPQPPPGPERRLRRTSGRDGHPDQLARMAEEAE